MRFFVEFSYEGSNYHGWQIQPNNTTVQAELNNALQVILNESIEVVGAGRTDAGVHALQMFAHFDCSKIINITNLKDKLNGYLPKDISIHDIFLVNKDSHSRFDALSRTYCYHISYHKNVFNHNTYYLRKRLNVEFMNKACKFLIGKQDFSSFSKSNTQTFTNDCDVIFANWQETEKELVFTITADRFLRNMVRAIIGTMLEIGYAKIEPKDIKKIIFKKDRSAAGFSVPAKGLFLQKIVYPNNIFHEKR